MRCHVLYNLVIIYSVHQLLLAQGKIYVLQYLSKYSSRKGRCLTVCRCCFALMVYVPVNIFSVMSGHFQGDIHGAYTNTNNYCTNINQMISVLPKDTT